MYNNMNGYAPYRSSSGGRMWGMSHSLPSGMKQVAFSLRSFHITEIPANDRVQSQLIFQHHIPPATSVLFPSRYAFSPQDTDFTSSYPTPRRMYNDFPTSSTLASVGHMSSSSTSSLAGPGGGTNLIVNYLPQDMTDRELYALFRTIGPVNTCRIMRDFKSGYSFGYAFVDFCSEQDAIRAIKGLNGVTVRNKRLKVSYARPGGDHIKDTNLYVTNLPRTVTEEQLDIIFGKYGQIVQKNILRDKLTGAPRGVAFVRFNKREEAQEAISALNNVIPEGSNQPLTVRVAEEHGKQKAHVYFPTTTTNVYNNVMHRGRKNIRFQKVHPYSNPNFI